MTARAGRPVSRSIWLLCALFAIAGIMHFIVPHSYESIVPPAFPHAPLLVRLSGAAELLGALGLLSTRTRRAAGGGLVLLLIAVFPANIEMLLQAKAADASAIRRLALWLRLPLQPLLIWWVWRAAIRTRNAGN